MNHLSILNSANKYKDLDPKDFKKQIDLNIVTNFTDDYLKKALIGLCLENKIYPKIHTNPYKQYHFSLKQEQAELWRDSAQITFFFFDTNIYLQNEFSDKNHFDEFINDLKNFISKTKGKIIINTFPIPTQSAYETLHKEDSLVKNVKIYNSELEKISEHNKNVHIIDTNKLIRKLGEKNSRDMRHLYAHDIPFTHEFLLETAKEWLSYIKMIQGGAKKCIVVDLDNTLWGGVVGEVGPLGITLGPQYPGNAYKAFQNTLLSYYNRGVILAINSRNNEADVLEVFEKNKEMVLSPKHFASMAINWNDKATNLKAIAEDLNIGIDSLVFIDDDTFNRELVKKELPEVLVPDFEDPTELSTILLGLNAFPILKITEEDKERNKMYADEKERKQILTKSGNIDEYIKKLNIKVRIEINSKELLPRLAQLTQKTNQFNLTTKRYTEEVISNMIKDGALLYSGDVVDSFGPYGITIMAIVKVNNDQAELDNFLMSCRIMGRGIEYAFISKIIEDLKNRGINNISASYIPTQKNPPAKDFLQTAGLFKIEETIEKTSYKINLDVYNKNYPNITCEITK